MNPGATEAFDLRGGGWRTHRWTQHVRLGWCFARARLLRAFFCHIYLKMAEVKCAQVKFEIAEMPDVFKYV